MERNPNWIVYNSIRLEILFCTFTLFGLDTHVCQTWQIIVPVCGPPDDHRSLSQPPATLGASQARYRYVYRYKNTTHQSLAVLYSCYFL